MPAKGVNHGGLGVATPRFWAGGRGGRRGSLGSWIGRDILLYLIMHIGLQEICSIVVNFEEK